MPEFILNKPRGKHALYDALDGFAKGYVEAMFFTNCDSGEELGVERLTRESIVSIKRDCDAFQAKAEPLLNLAYDRDDYDKAQAGRDFWFTRQGYGVGYWDRPQLRGASGLGDRLSEVAESFGEATATTYRGWIHYS